MGSLQGNAKPFLIPLFRGERASLDKGAQAAVATWITMATMTSEFISRDHSTIAIRFHDRGRMPHQHD
jgi:hypothetical protein